ncbi:hypothetical protein C8R42DRAFT_450902 [Lentinula raphanica]|nr:hypothetical protein C8R42DRAFT_450902 [Lentinula raphanica]KAJ3823824.1 hypothetical protein F5880DRAFT_471367 [Lentinula raphanica]
MQALTWPLLLLIFTSKIITIPVTILALAGLVLGASPLLSILPVASIATVIYYLTMLSTARFEPQGSERLYSRIRIIWGVITAVSWTMSVCVIIVAIVLRTRGVFPKYETHVGIWLMVTCAILALVECVLSWAVAILVRKERKRITYAAKWRPSVMDHSWSLARR